MKWHIVKAVSAHMADWGFQTTAQAIHKPHCAAHRARHVGIVACSHAMASVTSEGVSWRNRALYVAVNAVTHYAIDSVAMPKWLDQALHVSVAVFSARFLRGGAA
jgi:hypothetical protein